MTEPTNELDQYLTYVARWVLTGLGLLFSPFVFVALGHLAGCSGNAPYAHYSTEQQQARHQAAIVAQRWVTIDKLNNVRCTQAYVHPTNPAKNEILVIIRYNDLWRDDMAGIEANVKQIAESDGMVARVEVRSRPECPECPQQAEKPLTTK